MKRILALILVAFMTGTAAMAQTILATWTFDNLPADTSANGPTPKVIPSNTDIGEQQGSAFIYADGSHGSADWLSVNNATTSEITSFGGYTNNDPRTPALAGKAFTPKNTTANGKAIVLAFATTGYQNPVLSFVMRKTNTGFNAHVWEYSTDGTTFHPVTESYSIPTTTNAEVKTLDLSAYDDLDNTATVYLRLTLSGCTSASGNTRFDNIVINAETSGPDVTAPRLSSYSVLNDTHIKLIFNEQLNASIAQTASNYTLSGGITASSAALANNREVTLTLANALTEGSSYTLTIRNIADLASNVMSDSTFNFTYGINPQYHVATIAELRSKWTTALDPNANTADNTIYKLTGDAVVTAINSSYRNQIFIQDSTAAIVIDNTADNTTNGPAILTNIVQGDKINSIYGSLTNYYGHLQLVVKQPSYTKTAEYAEVDPIVITLTQLNDNNYMNSIQSQLIKINSVRFENPPAAAFANNTYYKLRQGEVIQDSAVWTHIYNELAGTIPTTNKDITGVNKITRNTYCVIPRKEYDIKEPVGITSVGDFNAAIYPNPVQDLLTVQASNQIKNIEIFNMFGQRIHTQQGNSNVHQLNVSDLSSGIYMIKLTSNSGFATSKFVKR